MGGARRQKLSLQKVAAVGLAVTGIALVHRHCRRNQRERECQQFSASESRGLLAALLASFSFAFYNIVGHGILSRYDRWRVLLWTLTAASAFLVICESALENRRRALHRCAMGIPIRILDDLGARAFSLYFSDYSILNPPAPSSPVAYDRCSPFCWLRRCLGK